MKASHALLRAGLWTMILGLLTAGLPVSGKDAKASTEPPDLQVSVDVPPTWRPFLEDDIAEVFVQRLAEVFRRSGYAGRIAQVERLDDPAPGIPHLQIRLIEWRIDRTGYALCTFGADLKTADKNTSLGLVSDSAVFWPGASGHWGLMRAHEQAGALEDAAESALRDFYRKLAKSGLVPGLTAK